MILQFTFCSTWTHCQEFSVYTELNNFIWYLLSICSFRKKKSYCILFTFHTQQQFLWDLAPELSWSDRSLLMMQAEQEPLILTVTNTINQFAEFCSIKGRWKARKRQLVVCLATKLLAKDNTVGYSCAFHGQSSDSKSDFHTAMFTNCCDFVSCSNDKVHSGQDAEWSQSKLSSSA